MKRCRLTLYRYFAVAQKRCRRLIVEHNADGNYAAAHAAEAALVQARDAKASWWPLRLWRMARALEVMRSCS